MNANINKALDKCSQDCQFPDVFIKCSMCQFARKLCMLQNVLKTNSFSSKLLLFEQKLSKTNLVITSTERPKSLTSLVIASSTKGSHPKHFGS